MVDYGEQVPGKLFVVFGPSGCGKTTFIRRIVKENPDKLGFSISHTTRSIRDGEQDGREYYFVSRDFMEKMIDEGEFLETTDYAGNLYGTSIKELHKGLERHKNLVFDVDLCGVKNFKRLHKSGVLNKFNIVYIFIKTLSPEVLETRLRLRMTQTEDEIQRRVQIGKQEILWVDENRFYDHCVINSELEPSYAQFKSVLNLS